MVSHSSKYAQKRARQRAGLNVGNEDRKIVEHNIRVQLERKLITLSDAVALAQRAGQVGLAAEYRSKSKPMTEGGQLMASLMGDAQRR